MNDTSVFLSISEDFVDTFLPVGKGASPNTIKSYKYAFRLLIEYMFTQKGIPADKVEFSSLDYATLLSFFEWITETRKCSTTTRNQRLAALLSFSEYAQNRDYDAAAIFRSSIIKIPLKNTLQRSRTWFDSDEIQILLALPDEHTKLGLRDKVLLCVLYATGARAQEICDFTVSWVKTSAKGTTIDIIGKGNKRRRVKISDHAAAILNRYILKRHIEHSPDRHIFSSQSHEQMTISCIEAIVKKYVKMAKTAHPDKFLQEGYSPHSFRHTTATHMIEAGVPLMVIKNFLGHASIQTTQIYAELTQNTVDKHVREWNEKWFPRIIAPTTAKTSEGNMPDFLKL